MATLVNSKSLSGKRRHDGQMSAQRDADQKIGRSGRKQAGNALKTQRAAYVAERLQKGIDYAPQATARPSAHLPSIQSNNAEYRRAIIEDGATESHGSDTSSDEEQSDSKTPAGHPYLTLLQSFQVDRILKKAKKFIPKDADISNNIAFGHNGKPQRSERDTMHEITSDLSSDGFDHDDASDNALEEARNDTDTEDEQKVSSHTLHDPFHQHFAEFSAHSQAPSLIKAQADGTFSKTLQQQGDYRSEETFYTSAERTTTKDSSALQPWQMALEKITLKQRLIDKGKPLLSGITNPGVQIFAKSLFEYRDTLMLCRDVDNATSLRDLASLHILNHIFKTRDVVLKNNAKLAAQTANNNAAQTDLECRDQGFTRPKILIIVPTRQSARKYIESMLKLWQPEQQENAKRFSDQFISTRNVSRSKPHDFRELFDGNDDDMFRLGVKFTRKTMKYYSSFYNSDIIIASPLGLRMIIGDESKAADFDFLSSIEMLFLDQCHALAMQNWEHVTSIFEKTNQQPKDAHGCDFARVKDWYLDKKAAHVRQTICISPFNFPALNKIYNMYMLNFEGKTKLDRNHDGAILSLGVSSLQIFSRFEFTTPLTEPEERFAHFQATIIPSLIKNPGTISKSPSQTGILVFVSCYADFTRLRNHFDKDITFQNVSFGCISEYTPVKEAMRLRSHFSSGKIAVLLYTERAHHFRRTILQGVTSVVMYSLPENPIFYTEIAGLFIRMNRTVPYGSEPSMPRPKIKSLFCRLDALKLERIVGTSRCATLLSNRDENIFEFS